MTQAILIIIVGYLIGFFCCKYIEFKKRGRAKKLLNELKNKARKNRYEKNI
jgi:hypothetical protein